MIYTYPNQPQMQVEVILASTGKATYHPDLITMRLRYPRIIHAEIMTHRVFSRNARSSRAVPVKTMLDEVRSIPFVPWHWGKNQKGMQAGEDWDQLIHYECDGVYFSGVTPEQLWLHARDTTADIAEAYMEADYHKQIPNRLLEPYSWIDTLITATNWDNFLHLRDHKDAEPHLRDLARLVRQAIEGYKPQVLEPGQWHLPYITEADRVAATWITHAADGFLCKISAARCARISYAPFDGDSSYERELARYDSLVNSDRVHASPLEHQAQVDRLDPDYPNIHKWECEELSGNFAPGWIQYRKTIPGESV